MNTDNKRFGKLVDRGKKLWNLIPVSSAVVGGVITYILSKFIESVGLWDVALIVGIIMLGVTFLYALLFKGREDSVLDEFETLLDEITEVRDNLDNENEKIINNVKSLEGKINKIDDMLVSHNFNLLLNTTEFMLYEKSKDVEEVWVLSDDLRYEMDDDEVRDGVLYNLFSGNKYVYFTHNSKADEINDLKQKINGAFAEDKDGKYLDKNGEPKKLEEGQLTIIQTTKDLKSPAKDVIYTIHNPNNDTRCGYIGIQVEAAKCDDGDCKAVDYNMRLSKSSTVDLYDKLFKEHEKYIKKQNRGY